MIKMSKLKQNNSGSKIKQSSQSNKKIKNVESSDSDGRS